MHDQLSRSLCAAHRDKGREWSRLKAKVEPLLTLGNSGDPHHRRDYPAEREREREAEREREGETEKDIYIYIYIERERERERERKRERERERERGQ